jgi:PAS domain S-box-containing protein
MAMTQQRTVLIIDDSPEDREAYRRYLLRDQTHHYIILEEESAEAGLAQCQKLHPDSVLLDFRLPDLDGLEFLEELSHQAGDQAPPVIMLTGQGDEAIAVRAMKLGAQDYLIKGRTSASDLLFTLNNVIENAQLRRELQQRKAELQESQQFIQKIVDTTPGIVYVYDLKEQCCVYINRGITDVLGYTADQISEMGATVLKQLMHPEDLQRVPEHLQQFDLLADGKTLEFEYRMHDAQGNWHWLWSQEAVFKRNASGAIQQILGIAIDVTERKQAEADRDRLLEREKAARAEAEAANRAKDEFVAMVTHDLRAPLNAIQGWAQLLRSGKLNEAARIQALETIERSTRNQARLIEDLLDISRMIQGRLELEPGWVDLTAVVKAAIADAFPAANTKQIAIAAVLDNSDLTLRGDASRLQQVLGNLLSNAIKFTPEGGRVDVRLAKLGNRELGVGSRETDGRMGGSYAQITVTDTGCGIPPELLPHVFDRYRQAQGLARQGGLGLGLAIARHIVELHGGTIQASSPGEDQGATFTIQLPLTAITPEDAVE